MEPFPSNICIVDDDSDFAEFLAEYLRLRAGNCIAFSSAEELIRSGNIDSYDFFVIDLGLPGIDGTDLTALVRGRSAAGILVISGRLGPDAFNSTLAAGADMFVNKPVRLDQVTHAISSIWRRFSEPRVRTTSWQISHDFTELTSPAQLRVALTPIESKLIKRLSEDVEASVSRADLALASGITGGDDHRNLDAAFFRLRRKIEREAGCPSPFRTVHGIGYQLNEDIAVQTTVLGAR
jgi:two-component system OmpR family response regulator